MKIDSNIKNWTIKVVSVLPETAPRWTLIYLKSDNFLYLRNNDAWIKIGPISSTDKSSVDKFSSLRSPSGHIARVNSSDDGWITVAIDSAFFTAVPKYASNISLRNISNTDGNLSNADKALGVQNDEFKTDSAARLIPPGGGFGQFITKKAGGSSYEWDKGFVPNNSVTAEKFGTNINAVDINSLLALSPDNKLEKESLDNNVSIEIKSSVADDILSNVDIDRDNVYAGNDSAKQETRILNSFLFSRINVRPKPTRVFILLATHSATKAILYASFDNGLNFKPIEMPNTFNLLNFSTFVDKNAILFVSASSTNLRRLVVRRFVFNNLSATVSDSGSIDLLANYEYLTNFKHVGDRYGIVTTYNPASELRYRYRAGRFRVAANGTLRLDGSFLGGTVIFSGSVQRGSIIVLGGYNANTVYVASVRADGNVIVFKSQNGTRIWNEDSRTGRTSATLAATGFAGQLERMQAYKSITMVSANEWYAMTPPKGTTLGDSSVVPEYNTLYKSTDQGNSWSKINNSFIDTYLKDENTYLSGPKAWQSLGVIDLT